MQPKCVLFTITLNTSKEPVEMGRQQDRLRKEMWPHCREERAWNVLEFSDQYLSLHMSET